MFLSRYQGSGADLTMLRRRTIFYVTGFVWSDIKVCSMGMFDVTYASLLVV